MALVVKDRVRETSTTSGTGSLTLNGAVTGFQSFSAIGDGNTTYYTIVDAGTGVWEVGIGIYTSATTSLSRDTVLESSSGGSLVNFGSNLKDVFVTYPAERSIYTDAAGTAITPATASVLGVASGGTGQSSYTNGQLLIGNTTGNTLTKATLTAGTGISITNGTGSVTVAAINNGDVVGPASSTDNAIARFDSTTGKIIQNSGVIVDDSNNVTGVVGQTMSGNLTFNGTAQRILGDFSNATVANRVAFQTSTVNGNTSPFITPNGTATLAAINLANASDPTNSSIGTLRVNGSTSVDLISQNLGTGTYLPMTFYTSGSEKLRIAADLTGTYTFGGTAPRITGDFSNATLANRVMFQTSTVNGNTFIGVIPNGTATTTSLNLEGDSALTNGSVFSFACGANSNTEARITSGIRGTGTYLPMTFYTGGSERMRVDTSGNVGIGTSSPTQLLDVNGNVAITGSARRITGDFSNATFTNRVAFQTSTVNGNTIVGAIPNGTGQNARIQAFSTSDPANASTISIEANAVLSQSLINADKTGTGTYFPMTFFTGGSERMRILTDGSISMTTSGSANTTHLFRFNENGGEIVLNNNAGASGTLIDFSSGSTRLLHVLSTGDQQIGLGAANTTGSIQFMRAGFVEAMRIDSSGNVGIGVTSPDAGVHLRVFGNATYTAQYGTGNKARFQADATGATIEAVGAIPITFYTNSAERMRIDSSGNLLVGTTSTVSSGRISVVQNGTPFAGRVTSSGGGGVGLDLERSVSNGDVCYFRSTTQLAGFITITGATTCTYNQVSDIRLKDNIVDASSALQKLSDIQVRSFSWKSGDGNVPYGFVAQELNEVAPEAVTKGKDSDIGEIVRPWGVDNSVLVPMLTKAIQEQQAIIESLKTRIEALENK